MPKTPTVEKEHQMTIYLTKKERAVIEKKAREFDRPLSKTAVLLLLEGAKHL